MTAGNGESPGASIGQVDSSTSEARNSTPPASVHAEAPLLHARAFGPPSAPGALGAVGRYSIVRILGTGGMGLVVEAQDPHNGAAVAIKLLKPELRDCPYSAHRFLSESRHMQQLSHPNVLGVLEVGNEPATPFYVMPYLPRGSLNRHIIASVGIQPTAQLIRVSRQVAEALAYAHSHGVIHRDLKPG